MTRNLAIAISDLKKRYIAPDGSVVPVVDVPLLELEQREQVALVGSSGSGKTTLLHLIAGILLPDSGRILFNTVRETGGDGARVLDYTDGSPQVDITRLSESQRDVFRGQNIGYIFQTHHLLPGFTAMENVQLGMSFTGRSPDKAWAKHLLQKVGLSDRLAFQHIGILSLEFHVDKLSRPLL